MTQDYPPGLWSCLWYGRYTHRCNDIRSVLCGTNPVLYGAGRAMRAMEGAKWVIKLIWHMDEERASSRVAYALTSHEHYKMCLIRTNHLKSGVQLTIPFYLSIISLDKYWVYKHLLVIACWKLRPEHDEHSTEVNNTLEIRNGKSILYIYFNCIAIAIIMPNYRVRTAVGQALYVWVIVPCWSYNDLPKRRYY